MAGLAIGGPGLPGMSAPNGMAYNPATPVAVMPRTLAARPGSPRTASAVEASIAGIVPGSPPTWASGAQVLRAPAAPSPPTGPAVPPSSGYSSPPLGAANSPRHSASQGMPLQLARSASSLRAASPQPLQTPSVGATGATALPPGTTPQVPPTSTRVVAWGYQGQPGSVMVAPGAAPLAQTAVSAPMSPRGASPQVPTSRSAIPPTSASLLHRHPSFVSQADSMMVASRDHRQAAPASVPKVVPPTSQTMASQQPALTPRNPEAAGTGTPASSPRVVVTPGAQLATAWSASQVPTNPPQAIGDAPLAAGNSLSSRPAVAAAATAMAAAAAATADASAAFACCLAASSSRLGIGSMQDPSDEADVQKGFSQQASGNFAPAGEASSSGSAAGGMAIMRQILFRAGGNIGRPPHEVEPVARRLEEYAISTPEALARVDQRLATQLHIPLRFHAALQDELQASGYEIPASSQAVGLRTPASTSFANAGLPGTGGVADGAVDDVGGGTGEACCGPTPRSSAAVDAAKPSAVGAFERHLQRHQRAREQKQRDIHAIRISATRWEYWDDPWLDTSNFSRCRRTVIASAGRGDQPGQASPRQPRPSVTSPRRQQSPRGNERNLQNDRSVQQGVKNTRLAGNVLSRCRTNNLRTSDASYGYSQTYEKADKPASGRESGARSNDPLELEQLGIVVSPSVLAAQVESMFSVASGSPTRDGQLAIDSDDAGLHDDDPQDVPPTCRISAVGYGADKAVQDGLGETAELVPELP